ncbi:MAG: shikimate kinase [Flavobacteriaceae bacterium]|nr:shikimate kinase [Flavobacteriaceae bacterium]
MKVILMGYMGSGKSTIGRYLSKELGYDFIDLDDVINKGEGQSIPEIFSDKGAIYFRIKESEYLDKTLASKDDCVIALGGGTPCYGNNMQRIIDSPNTLSIYLQASVPYLSKRLFQEKNHRPLISEIDSLSEMEEFIGKHLFERNQFYTKADDIVKIENKSVETICKEILDIYSKNAE